MLRKYAGGIFLVQDRRWTVADYKKKTDRVFYRKEKAMKRCKICGKEFEPSCGAQKFCSTSCREISKRRETNAKAKKKPVTMSLAEVAVEARKHGMTYGEYVSRYL